MPMNKICRPILYTLKLKKSKLPLITAIEDSRCHSPVPVSLSAGIYWQRDTPRCGMRREMLKGERGNFSCLTDGSAYN